MNDIHNPNLIKLRAETINLLDEVTTSLAALSEHRPFSEEVDHRITREFLPDRVTASLNIEGIGVTRRQTLVMMDAMTLTASGSKQERELFNALKADEYVYDLSKGDHALSASTIRQVNFLLQDGILESAGSYRNRNVEITGARFQPPESAGVPALMSDLVSTYETTKTLHPILKAAWLHASFTHIHPFIDGNGRTGRLLQDFSLLCDGLYPTGIPSHLRDDYYDALEKADEGDFDALCQMICDVELGVISRVQSIVDEVKNRGKFISLLVNKASDKKKGALHKQYTVWRQRMDNFVNLLIKTCDEINTSSDVIQVKSQPFDIIDFDKWKRISDTGGAEHTWAIKQTWLIDGEPLYRSIFYFKRHRFRSEDPFSRDDLFGNVALMLTGGEPEFGARFDFDNFADPVISLREILFIDGKLHIFERSGKFKGSDEVWDCSDPKDLSVPIQKLITDVFLKKLGIGT
ncbi:Fic family protein [Asticcacaulis sp. ZE23SCel15]|uniref:Fic family protein n=1 Tax=Asticcacaulis sp. ZE23SCel15 TaxID=3059027 RepID=UPI00265DCFEC|nr:Fic family protein [Asticcacaulis sp. ZE23SCel15]WKL57390.1 Fic family protein [Asticcacaulis sp. ZE23SCel15]